MSEQEGLVFIPPGRVAHQPTCGHVRGNRYRRFAPDDMPLAQCCNKADDLAARLASESWALAEAREAAQVYEEHHEAASASPIGSPLRRVHSALGDLANAVLRAER